MTMLTRICGKIPISFSHFCSVFFFHSLNKNKILICFQEVEANPVSSQSELRKTHTLHTFTCKKMASPFFL